MMQGVFSLQSFSEKDNKSVSIKESKPLRPKLKNKYNNEDNDWYGKPKWSKGKTCHKLPNLIQ